MKHAITLLEAGLDNARQSERIHRDGNNLKEARAAQATAWDCLDALELVKLAMAERKARKAQKGGQKP